MARMNTLDAVTWVVASHGEHDGFWFPFGLLWLALLGFGIWFFFVRSRRFRQPTGMERAGDIGTPFRVGRGRGRGGLQVSA